MCKANLQTDRQTDMHLFLCPPSDQRQYEPGAGLCVSAGLLALWQRVGLQTLCLCPYAPHPPHAGGGGGQLMVVCNIYFFSICTPCLCVCVLICAVLFFVCFYMASGDLLAFKRHFHSQMSHICKCGSSAEKRHEEKPKT